MLMTLVRANVMIMVRAKSRRVRDGRVFQHHDLRDVDHPSASTFVEHLDMAATLNVKIEFGGGLELLFSNERIHKITLPACIPASSPAAKADAPDAPANITYLIYWLKENLLKERAELFEENGTVYVYNTGSTLDGSD